MHDVAGQGKSGAGTGTRMPRLIVRCSNPACRTGWMRLWRNPHAPVFEGGWACSPECMRARVTAALRREEARGGGMPFRYAHRVPVGLLLVEQGSLSAEQLRDALEDRRRAEAECGASMRLGDWLLQSGVLTEPALTRALSTQWSCPVLRLEQSRPAEVAAALPRFLGEALGAMPVRFSGGRMLYLAFSGAVDRSFCYAVERMNGVQVAAGIAGDGAWTRAQLRCRETPGPRLRLLEAANLTALAAGLTRQIEAERPAEARLVRVHGWYWLRMWRNAPEVAAIADPEAVEDLLGRIGNFG